MASCQGPAARASMDKKTPKKNRHPEKPKGRGLDMQGPRQRLQGLYVLIRMVCSAPVCVACLRLFDGCSHICEAGLTRKRVSWILGSMHPEQDQFQTTSEAQPEKPVEESVLYMAVGRCPLTKRLIPGCITVNPYAGSAMAFIGGHFGCGVKPIKLSLSQRGDPWRAAARAVAPFGAHHSNGVLGTIRGRGGCVSKIYTAVLWRPGLA